MMTDKRLTRYIHGITLAAAGRILLLIIALVGIGGALLARAITQQVQEVERVWERFDAQRSEKVRALNALYTELGYGGMINHLKDLLLHGDPADAEQAKAHLGGARAALRRYTNQGVNREEQQAIRVVQEMLDNYTTAIETARKLVAEGLPVRAIDKAVKVDDGPALQALAELDAQAERDKARCSLNCKPLLLADLRWALGYGGMIHNFKNYILRGDPSYLLRARQRMGAAERVLHDYRKQPLNALERTQLDTIGAALQRYQRGFDLIEKLQTAGEPPQRIDDAVVVDDDAVLHAIETLLQVNVAEGERDSIRVYDALSLTRTLGLSALLIALGMTLLLSLLAWWLFQRRIVQPIQRITHAMDRLSDGALDTPIPMTRHHHELGRMAAALQVFKSNTQDYLQAKTELQTILDNAADSIIVIDQQGCIKTVNPAACRLFEYSEEDLLGQNVKLLMPPSQAARHDDYLRRYLTAGESNSIGGLRELEGQRRSGARFPLELRISEVVHEEQSMFIGILRDITERRRLQRMKSEFVSTVSHELRTPLTSILGSLGLMRGGATGELPTKAAQMLEIAHNNAERLVRLINDILDTEKIESGRMEFRMQPIALPRLLEKAVAENRGYGERHDVRLVWAGGDPRLEVRGDQDRLLQVMANLLSNAIKFSPEGGEVEVTLEADGEQAQIRVTDQGPGIPKAFQQHMFQKFSQADSSDSRQKAGTGLGLVITKAIVEHHGGTIGYRTATGAGTTFEVRLPLSNAPAADHDRDAPATEGRVLVCEDDPDVGNLLQILLRRAGLATDLARSAEEAKRLLAGHTYLAMTLDLGLPEQDGIALLRELRDAPSSRELPVLVVSAKAEEGRRELNGGAINILDWMQKPIDERRLLGNLRHLLPNGGHPCILHVEDDPDLAEVVATMVGEAADIQCVSTLAAARQRLATNHYHLVILDLILPDGRGEELLPLLQTDVGHPIPVIVFSARELDKGAAASVNQALLKSMTSNAQLLESIMSQIDPGHRR